MVNTREDYDREIAGLKLLTSGIADGIIIASTFQEYKDIAPYLPAGFPAVQIEIRLILWQMRDRPETGDTHSCSAEQGNPVQNRNTAGRPAVL